MPKPKRARTEPSAPAPAGPDPAVSTSKNPARRLILIFDGTANNPFTERKRRDKSKIVKPTNPLKLARSVLAWAPATAREQVVYYDIGVGALALYPGATNRWLGWADKLLGGLGAGFEGNVEDALHFLALNHRPGDEVFLFGFSRGAATARAVTRFLDWSKGLPRKDYAYYLPFLFRAFVKSRGTRTREDVLQEINRRDEKEEPGRPRPKHEEKPLRLPPEKIVPVAVRFLGVWDTVMALGSRFKAVGEATSTASKSFYMSPRPDECVQHARQALAIDEVRYDFRPEVWQGHHPGQTLEQRWFAGVHSNVGGSYPEDGLANLAFQWMLKEATAQGLEIDVAFARHYWGWARDRMYRSDHWYYRLLDGVRRRLGRGRRSLVGHPAPANLHLDASVIRRIQWSPEGTAAGPPEKAEMERPYRPPNVIRFLAEQPHLDAFLAGTGLEPAQRVLPSDVLESIEKHRKGL